MQLNGYYEEEELIELLQDGKIDRQQFYEHHSEERMIEFHEYCKDNGLEIDVNSAELFSIYLAEQIENCD